LISTATSVDTNRYSVPERLVGQAVSAHKHPSEIVIYHRGCEITRHPRLIGQRDARHTLPGHHPTPTRANRSPALEAQLQRGGHPSLERYAAALKQRAYGRGVRALRRLLELKRTYPSGPFLAAVDQALRFGLFDLQRLETLILKHVAGDFFNLESVRDEDA
jgi:Mu transposase, C-terminal domain